MGRNMNRIVWALCLVIGTRFAYAVNPGIVAEGLEAAINTEKAGALASKLTRADAVAQKLSTSIEFHDFRNIEYKTNLGAKVNTPDRLRQDFFKLAESDSSSRTLFNEFKADAAKGEMALAEAQIQNIELASDGSVVATVYAQGWNDSRKVDALGRPLKQVGHPRRVGADIKAEIRFKNLAEYNKYVAGSMYQVKQVLPQWMRFVPVGDRKLVESQAELLMGARYSRGGGQEMTVGPSIFMDPLGRVHVSYQWTPSGYSRLSRTENKIFNNITDYNRHVRADGKELGINSPYRIRSSDMKPFALSEQTQLLEEKTQALDDAMPH